MTALDFLPVWFLFTMFGYDKERSVWESAVGLDRNLALITSGKLWSFLGVDA